MTGVITRSSSDDRFGLGDATESRLRLQTIVRLRWLAVLGQILAIGVVTLLLGFPLPVGPCLIFIAMSAWLNVYLSIRFPARHRLSIRFAMATLAYDIVQLAGLLYLTGGIENPFTMLIVAPVTVSAATLPLRHTIALGLLAVLATTYIAFNAWPLPWRPGEALSQPFLYRMGMLSAVVACMTFLALYAWRISKEGRLMSAALAVTELVLAREQKLHALDGLAAAAAHELGTPLSTITLVTSELERQMPKDDPFREDITLLKSQSNRCREILQKLTQHPESQDPLIARLPVEEMMKEAAAPYRRPKAPISISVHARAGTNGDARNEPIGTRRPGVIYGLGNIIENAIDFAGSRVEFTAEWDGDTVVVTVADDGPGFKPEVIDSLGEPYVTTRSAGTKKRDGEHSGLGLGFFIAKTLLERSGARLSLENLPAPQHGAVVRVIWPRQVFEAKVDRAVTGVARIERRGDEVIVPPGAHS